MIDVNGKQLEGHHSHGPPQASWDLYEMTQALWQAPSYHLIFEVLLIIWIIRLLFIKSYKPQRTVLTEKEKNELIDEWQPEPLVPDVPADHPALVNLQNRVIEGQIGKYVKLRGQDCINMASMNFLGMVGRKEIEEDAVKSLRKYGVGSCGPRGFFGTVDVHLELEEKLAKFMGSEEAIVYSYGFATIASAIPAYSKRGDVIFCDEGVHFAIQQGILASRSRVVYFKHNDVDDLERLLKEQEKLDKKDPKKAKVTRRFLVIEGLYMKYGDLCPLPKLVELKWKYKVRIFMDETISFGTVGHCGRGVTEHYGVSVDEVDLIAASLENALGTTGGFCFGKAYVVDHQRLSGLGYCFSASTPPMLSQAAICALKLLQEHPEIVERLQSNAIKIHETMSKIPGLKLVGDAGSPVLYLQLKTTRGARERDVQLLRKLVDGAEKDGVVVSIAAYLEANEHILPPPSIRLTVNSELEEEEIQNVHRVLTKNAEAVLS